MPNRFLLRHALLLLVLLCPPLSGLAAGKCERLVATGHPQYPPYSWRDPRQPQRLVGAQADLLGELGKALGVRIDLLYSRSWEKAQEEVRSGRIDLLAGAPLTLRDLETMDYMHPPLFSRDAVIWVRNIASFPYIEWADLLERRGAAVTQDFGAEFNAYAEANLQIAPAKSLGRVLQQLMRGEVDYVLHERGPTLALAHTLGLQDDLQALEPPIRSAGLHLALSHNSACNDPWLRGQLAKKMTEFATAGLPETLLQANLQRWKAQQLQAESASDE